MDSTKPNERASVATSVESLKEQAAAAKDSVAAVLDGAATTVDAVKSRTTEITNRVRLGAAFAMSKARSTIAANPYKSIAVAFALGYVTMRIRTSWWTKLAAVGGLAVLGERAIRN